MNTPTRQPQWNGSNNSHQKQQHKVAATTSNKKKLPFPVSIEVYNLLPKIHHTPHRNNNITTTTNKAFKKWFYPEYTTNIIPMVHMEIVTADASSTAETASQNVTSHKQNNCCSTQHTHNSHKVLYSSSDDTTSSSYRTQCPIWNHLHDSINYTSLSVTDYESMKARFYVVRHNNNAPNNSICDDDNETMTPDSSGARSDTDVQVATATIKNDQKQYIFEIGLHPSKLCRIGRIDNNSSSILNDINLPLNCTVVRFSDHTIRVPPADYQLLLPQLDSHNNNNNNNNNNNRLLQAQQNVEGRSLSITPPPSDTKRSPNQLSSPMRAAHHHNNRMFDDDVFAALDQHQPSSSPPRIENVVSEALHILKDLSIANLLDQEDDEINAMLPINDDANKVVSSNHHNDSTVVAVAESSSIQSQVCTNKDQTHISVFDDMSDASNDEGDGAKVQNGLHHLAADMEECDDHEVDYDQITRVNRSLELLIREEELALENESRQLRLDTQRLSNMMETISIHQDRCEKIASAIRMEQIAIHRARFILEAQRIRLVRELAAIYPITVGVDRRYFIRGAELPREFFVASTAVPEDIASAALGFLCHVAHLLSKYLHVHLRYRLHCQSSRSAIQDDRDAIYPLFIARRIEREQAEYGIHLLDQNIDCICRARGIQVLPKQNMLAKTLRIYENVIDGY